MNLDSDDVKRLADYQCDHLLEIVPERVFEAGFNGVKCRIEIVRDMIAESKSRRRVFFPYQSHIIGIDDVPKRLDGETPKIALFNALRSISLALNAQK